MLGAAVQARREARTQIERCCMKDDNEGCDQAERMSTDADGLIGTSDTATDAVQTGHGTVRGIYNRTTPPLKEINFGGQCGAARTWHIKFSANIP